MKLDQETMLKILYGYREKLSQKIKRYVANKNKEIENIDNKIKLIENVRKKKMSKL